MRIETWYLTAGGWLCGTTVDAGVETAVSPPAEHATSLEIARPSADSWDGASFHKRLSRDQQRAPALEERFGALPPPMDSLQRKRSLDERNARSRPASRSRMFARWSLLAFVFNVLLGLPALLSGKVLEGPLEPILLSGALAQLGLALAAAGARPREPSADTYLGHVNAALLALLLAWAFGVLRLL